MTAAHAQMMAELSAQYSRRCCAICGAEPQVHCIGSDAEYVDQLITTANGTRRVSVLVRPATISFDLCLAHAAGRWPWHAHKQRRRRGTAA